MMVKRGHCKPLTFCRTVTFMGHMTKDQRGFSSLVELLVVVIVAVIALAGWYVFHTRHTDQKDSGGSSQMTGNGTDNQSLQNDVNSIDSSDNQGSKDLNAASGSLNDNSTFTSLP